ncbi:MAG: amidophosphoribosyltransferase [Tenuifilaceae bacterium]|nr:amidophosphoribosyltransferase [Tenuifilaceae bacterium]
MSGFFGCISKTDCVADVYYGTDYHSHLGTKRAGLAYYCNKKGFQRAIHSIENGYFRNKFEDDIAGFVGNSGIGVISDSEAQPIVLTSHLGRFAIATVGRVNNLDELEKYFIDQRRTFSETSQGGINPTELVGMLISEGNSFVEGIRRVFDRIKGSCSIMLLTDEGILAARDKLGRTPIVIGKKEDTYSVAFETCSFSNLGYEIDKYMGPGEIIRLTADGYEQLQKPHDKMQICSFLWVYYGYPPSFYENINVEECRYRCGAALGKYDTEEVDFVTGIPDSGIGHAIGYSNQRYVPLMRPYSKYTPTWPRSFMPQNQQMRKLVSKMKLIPNPALIKNKRGVFLDDSIVRGTQLTDNAKDLYAAGIKEAHIRIACPPLTFPCKFLNFSQSRSNLDLATHKAVYQLTGKTDVDMREYSDTKNGNYAAMVEQMRKNLGLNTLKFQKVNDLVKAIGLPKEKLCTHCFDGSSYFNPHS